MDKFVIEFIVQQPQGLLLIATVFKVQQRLLVLHHFKNAEAHVFAIQLRSWTDTWLDREKQVAQWTAGCDGADAIIIIESLRKHAGAEIGEVASPEFRRLFSDTPHRLTRNLRNAIRALVEVGE